MKFILINGSINMQRKERRQRSTSIHVPFKGNAPMKWTHTTINAEKRKIERKEISGRKENAAVK